ncbi:hypothetical protein GCM10009665_39660 [Kitasatospora nipponensis]|uniref:Uncharacterized protein n=1 Tax=Kitasatospora nipponensis TaxID=258049 RepID=A0ABN1WE70_9ACTN
MRGRWWNFIGRTDEDIRQAREEWMNGTRFGEVHGYDGAAGGWVRTAVARTHRGSRRPRWEAPGERLGRPARLVSIRCLWSSSAGFSQAKADSMLTSGVFLPVRAVG